MLSYEFGTFSTSPQIRGAVGVARGRGPIQCIRFNTGDGQINFEYRRTYSVRNTPWSYNRFFQVVGINCSSSFILAFQGRCCINRFSRKEDTCHRKRQSGLYELDRLIPWHDAGLRRGTNIKSGEITVPVKLTMLLNYSIRSKIRQLSCFLIVIEPIS